MTKQFTFNTQRQYSSEGQIIKVIYDGDRTAHFMDTTRGLTGTVNFPHNIDQTAIVKSQVMTLYDLGLYEWLSEKDFKKKWVVSDLQALPSSSLKSLCSKNDALAIAEYERRLKHGLS
mgnify:CR=1 FL=1|tara:strand:+ start:56 stop:409 length:354 start_codon:yes stop_codon:yes gene_type:complete